MKLRYWGFERSRYPLLGLFALGIFAGELFANLSIERLIEAQAIRLSIAGEKETIYSLARDSYFADDAGSPIENVGESFLHMEKVFLVDGYGRIRGVYNGVMTVDMKRIIEDVRTLLATTLHSAIGNQTILSKKR